MRLNYSYLIDFIFKFLLFNFGLLVSTFNFKNKFKDQISIKYFYLFKYQKNENKIRKNIDDDIIEAKKVKRKKN